MHLYVPMNKVNATMVICNRYKIQRYDATIVKRRNVIGSIVKRCKRPVLCNLILV